MYHQFQPESFPPLKKLHLPIAHPTRIEIFIYIIKESQHTLCIMYCMNAKCSPIYLILLNEIHHYYYLVQIGGKICKQNNKKLKPTLHPRLVGPSGI